MKTLYRKGKRPRAQIETKQLGDRHQFPGVHQEDNRLGNLWTAALRLRTTELKNNSDVLIQHSNITSEEIHFKRLNGHLRRHHHEAVVKCIEVELH